MHAFADLISRSFQQGRADLPVDAVQAAIQASIEPITSSELLPLAQALGRVLARDMISNLDVPPHDNAAMDGFAFDGALCATPQLAMHVAGTALAGHPYASTVAHGECVRVMTGAAMPAGCDTVVPIECCEIDGEHVRVSARTRLNRGDHRRSRGEDLAVGQCALHAGKRLTPADLGLAASIGVAQIEAVRRLRVACFSSGDEVCSAGETLAPGQLYDSNRITLRAMLERLGAEVIDLGIVRDAPDALLSALARGCREADAIVTTGGVGHGDADLTRAMCAQLGETVAIDVAMRPGRPLAIGRLYDPSSPSGIRRAPCYLFGLPGNPVAAMVSFYVFVRTALLKLQGEPAALPPRTRARCVQALRKRAGRTEFQRGQLFIDDDGTPSVRSTGPQGSGILRSMSQANCLIVLPHECGDIDADAWVDVIPLEGLV